MKLLIVDDEIEILKMLKMHLELEGYEVQTTPDPFEAVLMMREHLFNLVITDIRMPGMTGIELLKDLRQIHPLSSIYVITGFSNMSYVVECLANGACDYFAKPLTDMDLFLRVLSEGKRKIERWQSAINIGTVHDSVITRQ